MRFKILFLGMALFLSGCAHSEAETSDFKKTLCSVRQEVLDALKTTPVKQPVCAGSIVKGCQPVLYFDVNSAELTDGSIQSLDWATLKMLRYDRYNISLIGHADQTGDKKTNLEISEKRVQAVYEYLIEQGIDEQRIQKAYKGDEEPICIDAESCNELNRRVEVNIYPVRTDLKLFYDQQNEE